jgi:hypothetical protein
VASYLRPSVFIDNLLFFGLGLLIGIFLLNQPLHAKTIQISWKSVEYAALYEIKIEKEGQEVLTAQIKETFWTGDLAYGHYLYKVRALDAANRPGEWSQYHSLTVLEEINKEADQTLFHQNWTMKFLHSNFDYEVSSPLTGQKTLSARLLSDGFGIGWDRGLKVDWRAQAGLNHRSFVLLEQRFHEFEIDLQVQRRYLLESTQRPWVLSFGAGLQLRTDSILIPAQSGRELIESSQRLSLGPLLSLELRKQIADRLSLSSPFQYYLPISGGQSYQNWKIGIAPFYWLSSNLGLGGGMIFESRNISRPSSSGSEAVSTNGTALFVSLISTLESSGKGLPPGQTMPRQSTGDTANEIASMQSPDTTSSGTTNLLSLTGEANIATAATAATATATAAASSDVAVAVSQTQRGELYRGSIKVRDLTSVSTQLIKKIDELGGRKAGQAALGWKKNKNIAYFHFTIPTEHEGTLRHFLQENGDLQIEKEKHDRIMPEGVMRLILTLEQKEHSQ